MQSGWNKIEYDRAQSRSGRPTDAVNLSSNDRIAISFRLWLKGIANRRWKRLTNIWDGGGCESRCRKASTAK